MTTAAQHIDRRNKIRAMETSEIIALRDGTDDRSVKDSCIVALSLRGIFDIPKQSAADLAREEARLGRAYRAV